MIKNRGPITIFKMEIIKVTDGVVIIKNCLTFEEQKKLGKMVLDFGNLINSDGVPNFSKTRGRNYSNLDEYGEQTKQYMKSICERTLKSVQEVDKTMPNSNVTHLLSLIYVDKVGMGFHKDDGENDGDFDTPVISFTIGNSCIFEYKITETEDIIDEFTGIMEFKIHTTTHSSQLDSGDVIVFGGSQRMMYHRVKKVLKGTGSEQLEIGDNRINLTFRQATSVIGKEEEFSTEKYRQRINKQYGVF